MISGNNREEMNKKNKPVEALFDESVFIEQKVLNKLLALIEARWDSDTLKKEIQKLMQENEGVMKELITSSDKIFGNDYQRRNKIKQ